MSRKPGTCDADRALHAGVFPSPPGVTGPGHPNTIGGSVPALKPNWRPAAEVELLGSLGYEEKSRSR
jgi:hypothetical protein